MRMADADLLPYDFAGLADTVKKYVTEVKTLAKNGREEAEARKKNLDEGVYKLAADPHHVSVPPPALEIPPYLNFAPLDNALDALDPCLGTLHLRSRQLSCAPLVRGQAARRSTSNSRRLNAS